MPSRNEHRELWWPSASVELAETIELDLPAGFETFLGGRLERIQVAYETWGTLSPERDNVVLLVHPLASDPHATGSHFDQPDGWWDALVGPGRVIDTDRSFVICPNHLGGCYGTTGPRFPRTLSDDGEEAAFLEEFPLLTPRDLMRVERLLLEQLGVQRVQRVIGPSMGAMVAWEWAIEAGDYVEQVVAVAAPLRTTAYQIGLNWLQRRGIELDLSGDELAATAGQMIARGVGMLSYRSQVGLEEKFGREWFQKPGATLGKRGMYNIESWLRHHGKRIVKRFDPYTYILFSRAMDLHDVGEGRGGFLAALDQVRCHVLAVGISSDQLYTANEVRLGIDMLDHLGKSAQYAEIRSPHGHDAFLLEVDQLAEILGTSRRVPTSPLPVTSRELRSIRLGILGAGQVASRLLRLLEVEREAIVRNESLHLEAVAFAEIDPGKELDPRFNALERCRESLALAERSDLDVLLDLTRGSSSLPVVRRALERGIAVVTPNKTLVHEHGETLERIALERGTRLAYHNAIAAGWPLLYSVERPLGRERVLSIQALLSTTCNLILERIEEGVSEGAALQEAVTRGLTEPDPSLDVSGWDALQKLIMLIAHTKRVRCRASSIALRGIDGLDADLVREARALGYRIRLVALFADDAPDNGRFVAAVTPCAVPKESHLGAVSAESHVLVMEGERAGEMVFLGRGAGEMPVASAVLGDLIGLCDPERSWTGRYPDAESGPSAPQFARHIARMGPKLEIVEASSPGSVPLLDSLVHRRGR